MMPLWNNAGGLLLWLLTTALVILAITWRPDQHRRTDPACVHHRPPRTWCGQWWYNRQRGRSCRLCMRRWVNAIIREATR